MSLPARKGHQKGRLWPRSLLFMTSLLIPGTPHYMLDQHIIAMFSDWIVYKCLYNQQKPSGWCMTTLIWLWPANYVLSDMLLCVLIPDQARCPASAQSHLLLLSNRSLGKCPLACQCVNFFFFLPLLQEIWALLLCHLLCMRFIISWGKNFFMALSDNLHDLQSACMVGSVAGSKLHAALPERPVIFYSGTSTARPVIYSQEGRQKQMPPPSQPLSSLALKVQ